MKLRKFEILSLELRAGGSGPEQSWLVRYRAIRDKKWSEGELWVMARTEAEAKRIASKRFGGVK